MIAGVISKQVLFKPSPLLVPIRPGAGLISTTNVSKGESNGKVYV